MWSLESCARILFGEERNILEKNEERFLEEAALRFTLQLKGFQWKQANESESRMKTRGNWKQKATEEAVEFKRINQGKSPA